MPNTTAAHAETIVLTVLYAKGLQTWHDLRDLRPLLVTAGLSHEQQDAALRWLLLGNQVATEFDGTEVTVTGNLAPESSNRRNTPEWTEAAYALDTHQRADMIYIEPVDA